MRFLLRQYYLRYIYKNTNTQKMLLFTIYSSAFRKNLYRAFYIENRIFYMVKSHFHVSWYLYMLFPFSFIFSPPFLQTFCLLFLSMSEIKFINLLLNDKNLSSLNKDYNSCKAFAYIHYKSLKWCSDIDMKHCSFFWTWRSSLYFQYNIKTRYLFTLKYRVLFV